MRYFEIITDLDFGPLYSGSTSICVPVDDLECQGWRRLVSDYGHDLAAMIDDIVAAPTKIICPNADQSVDNAVLLDTTKRAG